MIEHINTRCNHWAQWLRTKSDNGLGFPRQAAFLNVPGGGQGWRTPANEAAWEIHQAVNALNDELKQAVWVFYLGRCTMDQKARDCRCHRDTLYSRIHTAHLRIMEWLNDEAAGLVHPTTCQAPTVMA